MTLCCHVQIVDWPDSHGKSIEAEEDGDDNQKTYMAEYEIEYLVDRPQFGQLLSLP